MLPGNANPVLQARLLGNRPADPIVVSFVGNTGWSNHHVHAQPGRRYDWRFLHDLPVYIAVKRGQVVRDALAEIFAVARLYPMLVDLEQQQAASIIENKPLRLWPIQARSAAWSELFA